MAGESDRDRFEDYEAIKKLKARYFRFLDTKQWRSFGELFAEDAFLVSAETGQPTVRGRQAIVDRVRDFVKDAVTVHQGHMPEIDLTSETTATGIWALNDIVIWPNGVRLDGYGHYHETYRKADGEWRIASSTLTRLHTDFSTVETA